MSDAEDADDGIMLEYDLGRLQVSANYPDDKQREGVIYSATIDDREEGKESDEEKDEIVKVITCTSCGTNFNLTKGEDIFMRNIFGDKYREPLRCKKCRMLRMRRKRTPKDKS
jgi:predicted RNA-binding Zn-ribbon protein involved in translation (DUF1610 family)